MVTGAFEAALKKVLAHEGGYVSDPADAGGETYKGVARVYNPTWPGWALIDAFRQQPGFPANLEKSPDLQAMVRGIYKSLYWDRIQGDHLPPRLAEEMMDIAVNLGVHRAGLFLQQALNLLNRTGQSWPDLVEDGRPGPATLKTLAEYIKHDPPEYLLKVLAILRGNHYLDYMRRSPTQERFARGWLSRVTV